MDTRLKSVTLLTLILVVSFFAILLSVSEARPLPVKDGIISEVNGVFRTLKGSGPTPGVGHRLKKLQNLGGMKQSGPSPGGPGHGLKTLQVLGVVKHSGPSPGEGHKYNNNNHS